ncbi:DMT family transporter [Limnobacter profundi]|jgi:drug/metabolite transporter (DMT)-like permease|uniref:DMT family transporter n=1 Tax=Limnobacter profundi TaxID=2732163 RepID=A0ABX6N2K9_9BURK|nr:DMT family transporter [Limnobacter sp. SAORIC-580]MBA4315716.1 EamA/RhaT family transporter [Alcaligenaceae bacterium]PZO17713.1 MAG: EamA/RhaT family transporter [Betaproteobacteria bacterium]PZO24667.1 MAG: EamA/RhaT family transporter [Betaproteobacteria bacterium]PZO26673.1 MAG: EamA/RhaT family transporter [Betaproteobacteria bacterium]QJR28328.1 DMT family transporter [Limnobacter sp. SAORIC-580]
MNQYPLLRNASLAFPFVLIWTSAFPAAKIGLIDSPPLLFLTLRFLVAGALMLAWAHWRGTLRKLTLQELGVLSALGLLNHALYLGLSWTGMGSLSSGLSTILISANPIVVAVLSSFLLREPLTRQKVLGLALGFLGVAFIVRNRIGSTTDSLEGFLLVLAALLTLAFGTVLYKKWPVRTDIVTGTGFQIILSGLLLLPVALFMEDWSAIVWTPSFAGAFAWLVLVVSITGYQLWFNLLERGSASAASVWFFLTPPLGLLAGAWLLNEPLNWIDFIGIVPVVLGIVLVTRAR